MASLTNAIGAQEKPFAFVFWEDVVGRPAYIDLCRDTMRRNLRGCFELVELDFESCKKWWPEAGAYYDRCRPATLGRSTSVESRRMALFSDQLRLRLVGQHGGLWLDADTIIFPRAAALAKLVQHQDFFCSEAELGTLANGLFGGRKGSPFLAALNREMALTLADRVEPLRWGEYGFQLFRKIFTQRQNDKVYIAPFGDIMQFFSSAAIESGFALNDATAFSDAESYEALIPGDALALTLFNNSTSEDERGRTKDELLSSNTIFSVAYGRAMSVPECSAELPETRNRAPFFRHTLSQEQKSADLMEELQSRLHRRNEDVARLKGLKDRLEERLTVRRGNANSVAASVDVPASRRDVFEAIYENDAWTRGGSKSGCGSSLRQTETLRAKLPAFLQKHGVRSLLDIPCGDFNWMRHVDLGAIAYIGADIVPAIIAENQAKAPGVDFRVIDLVCDPLPQVDCVVVRDCFSHLAFADIRRALANIRQSGSKYLLVTHFTNQSANADIATGQFHRLNFQLAPFSLPEPLDLLIEEHRNPKHADKSLALWEVSALQPGENR